MNLQVVCNLLESRSPPGIFECIDEISIIYAKVGRIVNLQVVCNLLKSRSPPGIFECIDEISIIYAMVGLIVNLQVVCNLLESRSPPGIFECIIEMRYNLFQGRINLQVVCNSLKNIDLFLDQQNQSNTKQISLPDLEYIKINQLCLHRLKIYEMSVLQVQEKPE